VSHVSRNLVHRDDDDDDDDDDDYARSLSLLPRMDALPRYTLSPH